MLFLVVLVLLVLVVFLVVGRQSTSVQKRRSGPWQQDDNSDLSVLSIAPPHDIPQTPPVHEASYVDTSTGNYANDHVNSGVSAGNVDYGSSGDSSGALGSGLADAIDWGSNPVHSTAAVVATAVVLPAMEAVVKSNAAYASPMLELLD